MPGALHRQTDPPEHERLHGLAVEAATDGARIALRVDGDGAFFGGGQDRGESISAHLRADWRLCVLVVRTDPDYLPVGPSGVFFVQTPPSDSRMSRSEERSA